MTLGVVQHVANQMNARIRLALANVQVQVPESRYRLSIQDYDQTLRCPVLYCIPRAQSRARRSSDHFIIWRDLVSSLFIFVSAG